MKTSGNCIRILLLSALVEIVTEPRHSVQFSIGSPDVGSAAYYSARAIARTCLSLRSKRPNLIESLGGKSLNFPTKDAKFLTGDAFRGFAVGEENPSVDLHVGSQIYGLEIAAQSRPCALLVARA